MSLDNDLFNAGETSFLITYKDIVVDVGYAFYNLTGYTKAELVNRTISEVWSEFLRTTGDTEGGPSRKGAIIFTRNLKPREVEILAFKGKRSGEKILVFKEKSNSRLDDKFIFIEQMFNENIVGIAVYSIPDLILLKANQRYLYFLDAPFNKAENSIGHPISKIITGFKGSQSEVSWNRVLATKTVFYNKECKCDKFERGITFCDSTISPVFENNSMKYIVENSTDVTDKVLNMRQLEEQAKLIEQKNRELEAIFENMSDALLIFDRERKPIIANAEARKFLADVNGNLCLAGDAFSASKYWDMEGNTIPEERMPVECALRGEKLRNERLVIRHEDSTLKVEINATQVYESDGKIEFAVICARDITEQINQEITAEENNKRLIRAEREKNTALKRAIEVKDEFLSLITHEFRTPLTVINSAVQAMELICRDELTEKSRGFLSKIRQNSYRQLRLVNNLLDITRVNAGRIKVYKKNLDIVFLTKAITESVTLYSQQKDITLKFSSAFKVKVIGIDEEKYERIMLNLLSNAIKFSPKGSTINVRLSRRGGSVAMEVKDSGVGIPRDKRQLIFEKFGQVDNSLTRQAEGTGIGLSLVKLFLEAMGGSISVRSIMGRGSTFTAMLPDETIVERRNENMLQELSDNRLIHSIAIEFSDIYL